MQVDKATENCLQLSVLLENGDIFEIEVQNSDTIADVHEVIAKERGILPYTFRLFIGSEEPLDQKMIVYDAACNAKQFILITTCVPSKMRLTNKVAPGGVAPGGLRVRRKPSLDSDQVGSIPH
jgi:hypothetical protein